jgi:DNA-binding NarL/FixJ family response regulator
LSRAASILLVEDESDARQMLALGLERLGHAVIACDNGAQALAELRPQVEVVITDLVMPRLDGISLLRALSERGHAAARIVITSFADKERTIAALNLGADYLLEKPFSVPMLETAIQKVLEHRGETGTPGQLCQRQLAALPLNDRERQLVVFVLKGMTNADVALAQGTSEQAIKSALYTLYRKLGIASRGELFHLIFPV